jgi:hypothetical protein
MYGKPYCLGICNYGISPKGVERPIIPADHLQADPVAVRSSGVGLKPLDC